MNFAPIIEKPVPPQNIILDTIFLINTGILLLLTVAIVILYIKDILIIVITKKGRLKAHKILLVWFLSLVIFIVWRVLNTMFAFTSYGNF